MVCVRDQWWWAARQLLALSVMLLGLAGVAGLAFGVSLVSPLRVVTWNHARTTGDQVVTHTLNGLSLLFVASYLVVAPWALLVVAQALRGAPAGVSWHRGLFCETNRHRLVYRASRDEYSNWRYVRCHRDMVRLPWFLFQLMSLVLLYAALFIVGARLLAPLAGALGLATARMARLNMTNCTVTAALGDVVAQCFAVPHQCPCGQVGALAVVLVYIIVVGGACLCCVRITSGDDDEEEEEEVVEKV